MNLWSVGVLLAISLAVVCGAPQESAPRSPIQRPRLRPKLALTTTPAAVPELSVDEADEAKLEQEVEQVKETTVAPPPTTTFRSLKPTTKRRSRSTTTTATTTTAATSTVKSRSNRRKNNSRRRSSTAAPAAQENGEKLTGSQDVVSTTTKAPRNRNRSRGSKRTSTTTTAAPTTSASTTTKRSRSRSRNRSRTKSTTASPVEGVIIDVTTRSSRRSKTRKGDAVRVTSQPKTTTQRPVKSKPTTVFTTPVAQKTSFNEDFAQMQEALPESPRAQTQLPFTESSSAGSLPSSSIDPNQPNPFEWEIKWSSGDSQSGANSQLGVQESSGLPGFFPHISPQPPRSTTFSSSLFNTDVTSLPLPQQTRPIRPLPLAREDSFFQMRDSAAFPKDTDNAPQLSRSSMRPPTEGFGDQNVPLNPFPFTGQPFRPEGTQRPQSKRPISVDNEPLIEPLQSTRAKSSTELPRSSKAGGKSRDDIRASSTPLPVLKSKPSRGPIPITVQPNDQPEKVLEFRRKPVEPETKFLPSKTNFNKDSSSPRPALNPQDVEVVFPVRKLSPLPSEEEDPLFSNNNGAFSRSTVKPIENFTERQIPSSTLNSALPSSPFEEAPRRKLKPFAPDGAIPDDLPPPRSSFNPSSSPSRRIPTEDGLELNPIPVNRVRPSLSEYSFFPAQSRVNNEPPVVKSRRISDSVTASSIARPEAVPSQLTSRDESSRRKSGKDTDEFSAVRERLPAKSSQSSRSRSETADSVNDQPRRNSNRDRSRSNASGTSSRDSVKQEVPVPSRSKSDREISVENVSSKRRGPSNSQEKAKANTPGRMMEDGMMKDGMMKDGMMEGGMMKDGMMKDGMMKDGMMEGGMMKDGMMKDGMMKDGMMKDGMMEDGMMKGGMMKDGMMEDGMMKDGMMKDGMMKDGMMKDGMMKDGMMKDGMMEGGMMKDGMMEGGMMKDGMMKDGMMEGGMMKDGMMKDGMMKDGMMKDGMMEDGMMKDGMMKDGMMEDGMMKDGMMKDGMMKDGMMKDGMMKDGMMKDGMMKDGMMKDGMMEDGMMKDGMMKEGMMKDGMMKEGMMKDGMMEDGMMKDTMMDKSRDGQRMTKGDLSAEDRIFREPVRSGFDRSQTVENSRRQKESGRVSVDENSGSRSKSRTAASSTLPTVRKPVNVDNRASTGRFTSDVVRSEDISRQRNRDDSLDISRSRNSKNSKAETWNGETSSVRSKSRNEDVPSRSRSNAAASQSRGSFDDQISISSTMRTPLGSEDFQQSSKARGSSEDFTPSRFNVAPENRRIAPEPVLDFQNQRVVPTSRAPALPTNQNTNIDPFIDPFNDRATGELVPANPPPNARDSIVPLAANPVPVQPSRANPVEPEQEEEEYEYDDE